MGLLGRILLILLVVMATEFVANTLLFERASHFALQEDDARRMAEHLVVARRVLERTAQPDRPSVAEELSTARFSIHWSRLAEPWAASYSLGGLRNQIIDVEPELRAAKLKLNLLPLPKGGNIAGAMELSDGSSMTFRAHQAEAIWSLTFGRIISLLAPTLALVVIGAVMIRVTLRPLRVLMRATRHVGTDDTKPVPEEGAMEVRDLIHAFNAMQLRIHRLINSRTQALAAVGHDLRTPLARLQLRLDGLGADLETEKAMAQDIAEMNDLLHSLQIYLNGESGAVPPERVDIAVLAATLVESAADRGGDALYIGPANLEAWLRPVAIRRALNNLIDNALHYGGNVRVSLKQEEEDAILILVDDDGPGIAEDKIAEVLHPFVRLDGARARNTRGMGLGLAIVNDVVRAEQGALTLTNRAEGGLRVAIRLPASPA